MPLNQSLLDTSNSAGKHGKLFTAYSGGVVEGSGRLIKQSRYSAPETAF